MLLPFKNNSLVEVTYLLIRFNKSKFPWNANNTNGNGVTKQTHTHARTHARTHAHQTMRKITLERVSFKVIDNPYFNNLFLFIIKLNFFDTQFWAHSAWYYIFASAQFNVCCCIVFGTFHKHLLLPLKLIVQLNNFLVT